MCLSHVPRPMSQQQSILHLLPKLHHRPQDNPPQGHNHRPLPPLRTNAGRPQEPASPLQAINPLIADLNRRARVAGMFRRRRQMDKPADRSHPCRLRHPSVHRLMARRRVPPRKGSKPPMAVRRTIVRVSNLRVRRLPRHSAQGVKRMLPRRNREPLPPNGLEQGVGMYRRRVRRR